jgi:hypothetical protein
MSRGLSAPMLAAIAAGTIYPVLFAEFDFVGGTVYFFSGDGSMSWNGHTWIGAGKFISYDRITERTDVVASAITFTLNGLSSDVVAAALGSRSRGRLCKVWKGLFNSAGTLLADPVQIFGGRMNQPTISDNGVSGSVSITSESVLVDLNRARNIRYTDEAQKQLYPGDTGLAYVSGLQLATIAWGPQGGSTPAATPGTGGGGPRQPTFQPN